MHFILSRCRDFLTGTIVNRPPSEYTVTSKLLIWIQLARILQQAFQHLDDHPQPSYSFILELDKRMRAMLDRMPSWLTSPEAPIANLPPNSAWVRNAFIISSNHKVLVLHRAFFLRYETSRQRAIEASRRILREAAHCGDTRMWTVPVCACENVPFGAAESLITFNPQYQCALPRQHLVLARFGQK